MGPARGTVEQSARSSHVGRRRGECVGGAERGGPVMFCGVLSPNRTGSWEHSQCQDANGPLPTARGTERAIH